jgi:methyl coenzyme M reductase subunit C
MARRIADAGKARKIERVTVADENRAQVVAVSMDPMHRFSKPVKTEITLVEGWGLKETLTPATRFSTDRVSRVTRRSRICARCT